jgi:hypothetical protein
MAFGLFLAGLEGRRADALTAADELLAKWRLRDPCGAYYLARGLAAIEHPGALPMLRRAIDAGYYCHSFLTRDPWLDPLRGSGEFKRIVEVAETGYRDAAAAFAAAGGETLLGPADPPR